MGIRKYGLSDETKIVQESAEAREIVAKIMDLSPSQQMILYIIHDLGMNLERNEHMKKITTCCKEISDDEKGLVTVASGGQKKLIV